MPAEEASTNLPTAADEVEKIRAMKLDVKTIDNKMAGKITLADEVWYRTAVRYCRASSWHPLGDVQHAKSSRALKWQ